MALKTPRQSGFGMTMPIVKHSYLLRDPQEIARTVHEAFAIARAFDDPRNVDQLERGRNDLLRNDVFRDPAQTLVRHIHDPFIGLNRAERIVFALSGLRTRQSVEQCAFANIGQANNSGFHGFLKGSRERKVIAEIVSARGHRTKVGRMGALGVGEATLAKIIGKDGSDG